MPPPAAISYGAGACLFSGDHGLIYSQVQVSASYRVLCIVMASIDVHGCCILYQGAAGSDQPLGCPEIFNTDQGVQFTGEAFTNVLQAAGIQISMDGRGRWMDNVFIERLWRSLKYEEVYLNAYESVRSAEQGIGKWFNLYNSRRRHQVLKKIPDEGSGLIAMLTYKGSPRKRHAVA